MDIGVLVYILCIMFVETPFESLAKVKKKNKQNKRGERGRTRGEDRIKEDRKGKKRGLKKIHLKPRPLRPHRIRSAPRRLMVGVSFLLPFSLLYIYHTINEIKETKETKKKTKEVE